MSEKTYTRPHIANDLLMHSNDMNTIYAKTPEPRRDMDGNILPPRIVTQRALSTVPMPGAEVAQAKPKPAPKPRSIEEDFSNYGR